MNRPTITIETIEMKVIYIRFRGSYLQFRKNSRKLFNELFSFAKKHQLIEENRTKVLTIYHDNPFITAADDLRTSVAMTVPVDSEVVTEGQISLMTMSGKFAVLHFELSLGEYEEAWKFVYSDELLTNENFKLRDAIPFELYVNEPPKNVKAKSKTDIYLPIE